MRKKFSKEFKLEAIELSKITVTVKEAAISLGIDEALLYRWRKEYNSNKNAFSGSGVVNIPNNNSDSEELKRIKRELKKVTEERDILKKAVSIFSKRD